jgi:arylsulfatase A-like enzyme
MDEFLWRQLPFVVSHDNGMFFEPNEYMTDYLSKEAVKAIKAAASADERVPFYLQVWFNAPHNPLHATVEDYNSPELSNITSHRLRVYAAMIKGLDRGVKRILDALEDTHQADNTIVIFSSDNGGAEYVGLRDINKPFRGWKGTFYEGGLRVPMFMKWPAKIPRMTTVREPVGHVDIFPTIAHAAIIPDSFFKIRMDGQDLVPLTLTSEMDEVGCDTSSENAKVLYWRSGHYVAARICNWKVQFAERPRKLWIYDLLADPTEQNNLMEQMPLDAALGWARNGCFPTSQGELATLFSEAFSNLNEAHAVRLREMCNVLQLILKTEELQIPPSWPALTELVMPIDHPINVDGYPDDVCGECSVMKNEEYIFWPI